MLLLRLLPAFVGIFALSLPSSACSGEEFLAENVRASLEKVRPFLVNNPDASSSVDMILSADLRAISLSKPLPDAIREEFITATAPYAPQGEQLPSYIELGARLGDQGDAIVMMAIGKLLGIWEILSLKEIGKVTLSAPSDAEILQSASGGYLSIASNQYFDKIINRLRTSVGKLTALRGTQGNALYTIAPIQKDEVIFKFRNAEPNSKTYQTVQVGPGLHVHDPETLALLNHSCDPNVRIDTVTREVIAIRDISQSEMLTFSYLTTEIDMDNPFQCNCGSDGCGGTISGARHTSTSVLRRYEAQLAPYVRELLDRP